MSQKLFLATLSLLVIGVSSSDSRCGINLRTEEIFKVPLEPYAKFENGSLIVPQYTPVQIHPWVVSFGRYADAKNWEHVCGGTIIAEGFVLTAHQCLKQVGPKGLVRAGDSSLNTADNDEAVQVVEVVGIHPHPLRRGDSGSSIYDLAVLEVHPKFTFTGSVRRICLPDKPLADPDARQSHSITVAGYGETGLGARFGNLLSVKMTVRPEPFCKTVYESSAINELRQKTKLGTKENKNSAAVSGTGVRAAPAKSHRRRPQHSRDQITKWQKNAATLIPDKFTSAVTCIGADEKGVGACKGDNGGPAFFFDTSNRRFVQIGVFSGSVGCGVISFPDVHVRLVELFSMNVLPQLNS